MFPQWSQILVCNVSSIYSPTYFLPLNQDYFEANYTISSINITVCISETQTFLLNTAQYYYTL